MPLADMEMNGFERYTVTDMLTGKTIVSGTKKQISRFSVNIAHNTAGLYLVETSGRQTVSTEYIPGETEYVHNTVYVDEELPAAETKPDKIVKNITRTKQIDSISEWVLALIILGGAAVAGGSAVFITYLTKRRKAKRL